MTNIGWHIEQTTPTGSLSRRYRTLYQYSPIGLTLPHSSPLPNERQYIYRRRRARLRNSPTAVSPLHGASPSLNRTPRDAAHQAHCTQAAAEGLVKQANTFDVVLITQSQQNRVTMQIARHLAVGKYKDIIAALQLLFRDVAGEEIINPQEDGEELRTLLRVLLRPIARLSPDIGMVMSEYHRAVIAAFDGEDKAAEW
jgi:hypothetical protein